MDVLRHLKTEPVGMLPLVFANTKTDRKVEDEHHLPIFGIGEFVPDELQEYFHDYAGVCVGGGSCV